MRVKKIKFLYKFLKKLNLIKIYPEKVIKNPLKKTSREDGAGCRIRTDDLMITNQLLYQLS